MSNKRIYLSSPTMNGHEIEYIKEAFQTNWIAPLGENVDEFEKELASFVETKHAAALSSGTAALHLAVKLCNIHDNDIVLCQDLTFGATVFPISYQGGRQVFVDSSYDTWNIDPKALEKAIEKYPNAKAVFAVNLYGTPCHLDEIQKICDAHHMIFVEDAAESLGATFRGKETGSFGKYGIFSFNGNKIITTSGGGMLVSDDEAAIKKARFWATQSREPARYYEHKELGYNYRMSNIVAGIGRGQMQSLSKYVVMKKKIYETYLKAFADIPEIQMNPYLPYTTPNFWLSCITISSECKVTAIDVMDALAAQNIETRPIWKPMHMQPLFANNDFIQVAEKLPVGEDIFNRGLCLPSDIKNTDQDMELIISTVRKCFGR